MIKKRQPNDMALKAVDLCTRFSICFVAATLMFQGCAAQENASDDISDKVDPNDAEGTTEAVRFTDDCKLSTESVSTRNPEEIIAALDAHDCPHGIYVSYLDGGQEYARSIVTRVIASNTAARRGLAFNEGDVADNIFIIGHRVTRDDENEAVWDLVPERMFLDNPEPGSTDYTTYATSAYGIEWAGKEIDELKERLSEFL